jgi:outer membrane murein-binding lipoprotein Lpp
MVQEGKVTARQATELLTALGAAGSQELEAAREEAQAAREEATAAAEEQDAAVDNDDDRSAGGNLRRDVEGL